MRWRRIGLVALPGQLFYSNQLPARLGFIARDLRGEVPPPKSLAPRGLAVGT